MKLENLITVVILPIVLALISDEMRSATWNLIRRICSWIKAHIFRFFLYVAAVLVPCVVVYAFNIKPSLERINTTVSIYSINNLTEWEDDISFYNSQSLPIASNSRFVYVAVPTPDGYAILKLENNTVTAKIPLEGYFGVTALYADEPDIYAAVTFPKDGNHYYSFLKITD